MPGVTTAEELDPTIYRFGPECADMESLLPEAEDLLIPTKYLIMLSQVRAELSPDHESLKSSIGGDKKMLQPISVVRMDAERLSGYMDFVNELWGAEHRLEDFTPAPDGSYYLVVAGHCRTVAAVDIASERGVDQMVPSKVYSDMSDRDIIALQIDENIHSNPSPEREAMAIVESYRMGMREGLWSNKTEFITSTDNKFSRYALNQALDFVDLPAGIRDFVFAGTFPYSLAVELGRSMGPAREYFGGKYPGSTEEDIEAAVSDSLQLIIARIHQKKITGNAARNFIKANVRDMENSLEEHRNKGNMTMFELELVDEREVIRNELKELMRGLAELPMRQHARAMSLHLQAFPGEEGDSLRAELVRRGSSYLGEIGVSRGAELVPDGPPTLSLVEAD